VSERAGNDNPDETTSVFTEEASPSSSQAHETTQVVRPSGGSGSGSGDGSGHGAGSPPWQRGQQAPSPSSPSDDGAGEHEAYRYGSVGTVVADQPTIAEQRAQNGLSAVPNPFLTPAQQPGSAQVPGPGHAQPGYGQHQPDHNPAQLSQQHAGPPGQRGLGQPPLGPGASVPLGAPGAIPVGGPPSSMAGGHDAHPRPTARPSGPVRARVARAPRKASLQIRRFDPWSVLKLSLVLSVAMFLMWLVAVGVLYGVLDGMGVWDKLNGAYSDLASVNSSGDSGGDALISAGRVFGVSAVVGVVNIVLFTAFATVSAFVYNVSADLAGGIEVTLSERD
jgi:Transmembrane domain of unknown function (DUF3566)